MENCYTAGFSLWNSLVKIGLDYSSAQTQIKIQLVKCTILEASLKSPALPVFLLLLIRQPRLYAYPQASLPQSICLAELQTQTLQ